MVPFPRRRVTLACVLGLLLAGAPAQAYVRTLTSAGSPMFWNRTVTIIHAYVSDPPAPLTTDDVLIATHAAAAAWSRDQVACTSMDLRVAATYERDAPVLLDGTSRLTFRRVNWCKQPHADDDPCYDPFALAVTSVFARKSDGEIVDADVELNAVNFTWSDLVRKPNPDADLQDLQNALTHEFGHLIGLDHTCFLAGARPGAVDDRGVAVPSCNHADPTVRATTMFAAVIPGDLERRTLSPDEVRAVCALYPPMDLLLEGGQPAGCALARRPPALGAGALALLGWLAIAIRRRGPPRTGPRSSTDR
jgi:hypothetical protein